MISYKDENEFFLHSIYDRNLQHSSNLFRLCQPILQKLNPSALLEVRANLSLKREQPERCSFHVDYDIKNLYTAIFYVNTCNGATIIKKESEEYAINSLENKIIIFPAQTLHAMQSQTDVSRRIVLNINFFK